MDANLNDLQGVNSIPGARPNVPAAAAHRDTLKGRGTMASARGLRMTALWLAIAAMACEEPKPGVLAIPVVDGGTDAGGGEDNTNGSGGGIAGGGTGATPSGPRKCKTRIIRSKDDLELLRGCVEFEGTLDLDGAALADTEDLTVLSGLTKITGGLQLGGTKLKSLKGLEKLVSVGGLRVQFNGALADATALGALASVTREIVITENALLTDLDLAAVSTPLIGTVLVQSNPKLKALDLGRVPSVGGPVNIEAANVTLDPATVGGSLRLQTSGDFAGLHKLTTVAGDVLIVISDGSFDGLSKLTTVDGGFVLQASDTITGPEALVTVGGGLVMSGAGALTLKDLVSVGGNLTVGGESPIVLAGSLSELVSVGGGLTIDCANTPVELPKLSSIKYGLAIECTADVTGLNALETIGGNLGLKAAAVTGLNLLELVPGTFFLDAASVTGLNSLQLIAFDFEMTRVSSVSGLSALIQVGDPTGGPDATPIGDLRIDATQLIGLSELSNLRIIGRQLAVTNNPKLTSVSGLSSLQAIDRYDQSNNPMLAECTLSGLVAHSCP